MHAAAAFVCMTAAESIRAIIDTHENTQAAACYAKLSHWKLREAAHSYPNRSQWGFAHDSTFAGRPASRSILPRPPMRHEQVRQIDLDALWGEVAD